MRLNNSVTLGLDIGIGSIGWILLEESPDGVMEPLSKTLKSGEVIRAAGVRLVDVPENPKTRELLSKHRQAVRRQRITLRRRGQRIREVRRMITAQLGVDAQDTRGLHHDKKVSQTSPWILRAEALKRELTPQELAVVLVHMAKHRGFLSNSKKDKADSSDTGKMLKAVNQLQTRLNQNQGSTFGSLMAQEPTQRNRSGIDGKPVYTFTPLRKAMVDEVRCIFEKQKAFGNECITDDFEKKYVDIAFSQRPLQSVASLIGNCAFLVNEKRAPLTSLTAERFRFLQRLGNLRLVSPNGSVRSLELGERREAFELLTKQKGVTYLALRKCLKLEKDIRFDGLRYGLDKDGKEREPEKRDIVGKSSGCAHAHATFVKVLGPDLTNSLYEKRTAENLHLLDVISKTVSDNDDIKIIEQELIALQIGKAVVELIMNGILDGAFSDFRGTMSLSLKAMDLIFPHLLVCGDYSKACEQAGFNHTETISVDWRDIKNPLVQHMVREVRRQVEAITKEFNVIPGRVHIETARDLGKSPEERGKINKGMDDKQKENEKLRLELAGHFNCEVEAVSATELLRYKLLRQQDYKCCYYMLWRHAGGEKAYGQREGGINIMQLRDGMNETQIDHILPYSRTFDSSFHNLGLCLNAANQNKGNRSPYEWIGSSNEKAWHEYQVWVDGSTFTGFKKRNFLIKELSTRQDTFVSRNLNDTRYICKVIMNWFTDDFYPENNVPEEKGSNGKVMRRVFARPGSLTAFLRKQWGLEHIKKDSTGKRTGDRHHLLDAYIVACSTEAMLQQVTKTIQKQEEQASRIQLPAPSQSCRHMLEGLLCEIIPSRAERGTSKGALHEDTLRSIVHEKNDAGEAVINLYSRTPITQLKSPDDVNKIKDAHRCPDIIRPLRAWLEAGKPKDSLPISDATGFTIQKVNMLQSAFSSGIEVKRGEGVAQASNGGMIRVDIFEKTGRHFMVPVYTWQAQQGILPNKAVVGGKPENAWLEIDETYTFKFSLYPNNYVIAEKKKETVSGYYNGSDRSTAAITLAKAEDKTDLIRSVGIQTLKSLRKFRVDRLGRLHEVHKEKRVKI